MIMRKEHFRTTLLAAFFILAFCGAARAQNLFRLFPEAQLNGFYGDNIPFRTSNEMGGFGTAAVAGFYLDYTSAARYASLRYDTFAQLFTHQTELDRAGEAQYVNATDEENLSRTTKLRVNELFYRDAPGLTAALVAGDQVQQFNTVAYQLLLANDRASINWFKADLSHYWGRNWSSDLSVHQETLWSNGNNSANQTSYYQTISTFTEYNFADRFSLGGGYQFYDFRLTQPGQPDEQMHFPFVRVGWQPLENLSLSGRLGVLISHVQGIGGQQVNPGGEATLEYTLQHAHLKISGGQEPQLGEVLLGTNQLDFAGGEILYDFTQRLTGNAGVGFHEWSGSGLNEQIISWSLGLSDRVNKWLLVYAKFVQLRRNGTGSQQFLSSGTQNGQEAVGDYFVVGFTASIEAYRWSWQ